MITELKETQTRTVNNRGTTLLPDYFTGISFLTSLKNRAGPVEGNGHLPDVLVLGKLKICPYPHLLSVKKR